MKNKYKIILIICIIIGICSILVGSIAYYRIVVEGSIKGSTGNAVFVLKDENSNVWNNKEINLGKVNPGDSGEFTVTMDASGSSVDMYATLEIERNTLPTNLKFYTTSDHKSELHKYYSFLEKSGTNSETLTIYWYWNPYVSDEEDSKFINIDNIEANVRVSAVQISEYAYMKNGSYATYNEETGDEINSISAFWQDTYRPYIRTINFGSDLSNLPSNCTEENLCWDISESATQKKKVYAYLIDSGLKDSNNPEQSLYNLYIVSDAPIFAPTDCLKIFSDFSNLKTINFNNNFNTSKVTNMQDMFFYNPLLDNIDVSTFNTKNVIDMGGMFAMCGFISLDLSNFNTENLANIFVEEYRRNRSIFSRCPSLTTIDLSSFNTTNVTNMRYMFYVCSSLTSLDLNSFNTTNVTNMSEMFSTCSSLTTLDLSGFNTSNVTNMNYMFSDCSSLTSLDLSSFNTSKETNMSNMFSYCSSLTSLDLSNFNTSSVTNMDYMFSDCSSLISLDLSSLKEFKYSGSGDNTGILIDCSSLENLNLRSLTKLNAYIIYNLNNLRDLDISNLYINSDLYLPKSDRLVTTINYIGTYSVYDIKLQKYIPSFNIAVKPSQGKITINYEAAAEPYLDQIISEHPEYNWVKGKLITAPTSS
ncbi:MAG: BspA family leucine-rich repeat surface protein [Firmicutes bacterium]|nr:BspA family leucine-rich repeat surface protein [Bacillota bacterium]